MTNGKVTTTIAPWLPVADAAAAVAFYRAAFGAIETYRLEGDEGAILVAQLAVENAPFWVQQDDGDPSPDHRAIRMILTVTDPDAMFAQAVAAGATTVSPVGEEHGWRTGRLTDPFGHDWEVARPPENTGT